MPEVIYPGAIWHPGAAAGYQRGSCSAQYAVCHYTVGRDSTGIGLQGYFHFLVSRGGFVTQFCEVDALAWHAGEHNIYGPGIEVEYLDEDTIFTSPQRDACGRLVRWLSSEWGFPLAYHDGAHDIPQGGWSGFVSHRSLIQSDPHSDYWPQTDWNQMVGVNPTDLMEDVMYALKAAPGTPQAGYVALVGETKVDAFLEANMNLAGITVVQAANQQDWDTTIAKRTEVAVLGEVVHAEIPTVEVTVEIDYTKLGQAITAGIKGL